MYKSTCSSGFDYVDFCLLFDVLSSSLMSSSGVWFFVCHSIYSVQCGLMLLLTDLQLTTHAIHKYVCQHGQCDVPAR